jgi:superfamily II DNA/RNA helicase
MGIKGRRKRQRDQEARRQEEGGHEEEEEEDLEDLPPMHMMMQGPYKLPPGMSATSTKMSNTERYNMDDDDYLSRVREEHANRKLPKVKGAGKGSGKGGRRTEVEKEMDRDTNEVLSSYDAAAANGGTLEDLISASEHTGNRKKGDITTGVQPMGMRMDNSLVGLAEQLIESLNTEGFVRMTKIQERAIPMAHNGFDILGQAKTGSGKTLAFGIPILNWLVKEMLRNGVVNSQTKRSVASTALIIAPTKELALQIYNVLSSVCQHINRKRVSEGGDFMDISCALITGGTKVADERRKLAGGVTIVVGTPGRINDHVKNFKAWPLENLKFLVLDEADRMLADGFQRDLDSILAALPSARQTFLFSATNSKSVRELARLSLYHTPIMIDTKQEHPVYVDQKCALEPPIYMTNDSDEEGEDGPTLDTEDMPSQLKQYCYIAPVEDRLKALYVFIKRVAKKAKTMIFCSTVASTIFHCQMMGSVGFHDDVLMLHGHMKHRQRLQTFDAFNKWSTGVLFCTDVAARGLDIPQVDWIVQFDPPLDPTEYIHRVGRTARAGSGGSAVIFLSEEEAAFVKYLGRFRIQVEPLPMPADLPDIQMKLEHVLQIDPVVAKSAVHAYRAHVGAYQTHLLTNTFNIYNLDLDALARAFALTSTPHVSLPKSSSESKKQEYVKGKLKAMNRMKKEHLRSFHQLKTKRQWTEEGDYIGMSKPSMDLNE